MKVKTLITAYMCENYIKQAIQLVLSQVGNFEHEIIVITDGGIDLTENNVRNLHGQYPQLNVIYHKENKGYYLTFKEGYDLCKTDSDYIQNLDGDDWFLSPHKTQEQIDLLEKNWKLSMCFCDTQIYNQYGTKMEGNFIKPPPPIFYDGYPPNTLLRWGNYIGNSSVLYRSSMFRWPDWCPPDVLLNIPCHIATAQNGDIGYLPKIYSAYRWRKDGSLWSSSSRLRQLQESVKCWEVIGQQYPKYKDDIEFRTNIWKETIKRCLKK